MVLVSPAPLDSQRLAGVLCTVQGLEQKCRQIHQSVSAIFDELQRSRATLSRAGPSGEGESGRFNEVARATRCLVDRGQDLVDDLSAFIADFTESEKTLCSLVEDCARASRQAEARAAGGQHA